MEKDEFTRRWRRLKNSDEKSKFLAEELKNELGPFDSFKNRLPTIKSGTPAYVEEFPYMKVNNLNAQLTYHALFGVESSTNRNEKSKLVNKIVEEMTNIPDLIDGFTPSTSQLLKNSENGSSKKQKPPLDFNEYNKLFKQDQPQPKSSQKIKTEHLINDPIHYSTSKPSTSSSNDFTSKQKPQKSPTDNNYHHKSSPKHKFENSINENYSTKKQRLDSPQRTKIEPSHLSPSMTNQINSRPNSRHTDVGPIKLELFQCKFPMYAIGSYYGYKIKKENDSLNLPDVIVSINLQKMPSVRKIMVQVKDCVKRANDSKSFDLTCALYLSGLMLYAVFESDPNVVNDLLREVLSILDTIRTIFLSNESSQSKNYNIISNMLYLADSHLCERLYENKLELACKRRQLMQQCQSSFAQFESSDELMPENFKELLKSKDQAMILDDLCSKDKVNIPKLYYQLLLENSQHSMLHERHAYSKRLAIQQMQTSEENLWKRLTIDMEFKLDQNSGIDIADAIFSLVYWIYSQENG